MTDEGLENYVRAISPSDHILIIPTDDHTGYAAVCHVAKINDGKAELGLSVLPGYRGRGYATRLFSDAISIPGIRGVYLHCLPRNQAMRKIALKAGMSLESEGGEIIAYRDIAENAT
jgi:RimJ/RimL family protein N-acetyltransferase